MEDMITSDGFSTEKLSIKITKIDTMNFGEDISEIFNYKFSFDNLCEIVERIGGTVKYDRSLNLSNFGHSGSLEVRSSNNFTIFLDPLATYTRNNFTLAHELGHYYLHYKTNEIEIDEYLKNKEIDCIKFRRRDSNILEWQANWFASSFLMPEKKLRGLISEYNNNYNIISAKLEVSKEAITNRVNFLDNNKI